MKMKWIIIISALLFLFCSTNIKEYRDGYIQGYTEGWRDSGQFKAKQDSIEKAIMEKCK